MTRKDMLFLGTVLVAVWNAALIWMTQVACYPLWPFVGSQQFHAYHLAWWHRVWWLFVPAGLAYLGNLALLLARPAYVARRPVVLAFALQTLTYVLTALYWAPLQAGLSTPAGLSISGFHELMWSHWLRVLLIWLAAAVLVPPLARRIHASA